VVAVRGYTVGLSFGGVETLRRVERVVLESE
jgi:hypothetical protein